jgi:hypothetical protein
MAPLSLVPERLRSGAHSGARRFVSPFGGRPRWSRGAALQSAVECIFGRSVRSWMPESFRVLPLRRCLAVCGGHALPDGWAEFTEGGRDCQLGWRGGGRFGFIGVDFGVGGPPPFRPLPGPTHFSLSCQRKVSKRKARRDGDPLLEFLSQGGRAGKLAALRQARSLFPPRNRNSRRHLGSTSKDKKTRPRKTATPSGHWPWCHCPGVWPLAGPSGALRTPRSGSLVA